MTSVPTPGNRSYGRTAGLLAIAYGAAGALTYSFFAVCSRVLSADEYGEIVVVWTAAFITFSTIARPIEPFLSRSIASDERPGSVRHSVRMAIGIQGALAVAFTMVVLGFKNPLESGLFDGNSLLFWSFLATVVGFSVDFLVRGYLGGRRRFGLFSLLLFFEGGARLLIVLALAFGLSQSRDLAAVAIAIAPLGGVLPVAIVFAYRAVRHSGAETPSPVVPQSGPAGLVGLTQGGAFTLGIAAVMLSEQILISSGPLLVRHHEGAAVAGFVFNELMLVIAPLLIFQAAVTTLLPHLTRVRSLDGSSPLDESLATTLKATLAFAILVALVVASAGPELMQIAFSESFDYPRTGLILVTCGMGFYLAATALNQSALAHGKSGAVAVRWAACGATFLAWNLLTPLDPVRAVETGFVGASALLFALLLWLERAEFRTLTVHEGL